MKRIGLWYKKYKNGTRKKGSVILLMLMVMIMVFVLAAIFINIAVVYGTINQMKRAAEEGARVRAQAIDIPLKEYKGVIEIFHKTKDDSGNDYDPSFGDRAFHNQVKDEFAKTGTGHYKVNSPYDMTGFNTYEKSIIAADDAAKSIVMQMANTLSGSSEGEKMLKVDPENICIDVKPLPESASEITFTCKTRDFGEQKVVQKVSGKQENTYDNKKYTVQNVVFVGAVFEYRTLIHNALEPLGWKKPPKTMVKGLAYPQVDSCFGSECK